MTPDGCWLRRALLLTVLAPVVAAGSALAQTKAPDKDRAAPATKPASQAKTQPGPQAASLPALPDNNKLAILIQNTLIAINQANLTGNYSVLRDLATPGFQSVNSAAQLAESFADLRKRGIDLSPIVLFQPKLVREAAIDDKGFLRLVGFHDTRPEQVQFELLFASIGGQWRLHGLGVRTVPATQPGAAQAPAQPAEKADAAKAATPAAEAKATPAAKAK